MSTQSKPYLTPEQYLEIERKAEYKSEYYRRQADGRWLLASAENFNDSLELQSVGCTLSLAGLYEKVDLSESEPATPQQA